MTQIELPGTVTMSPMTCIPVVMVHVKHGLADETVSAACGKVATFEQAIADVTILGGKRNGDVIVNGQGGPSSSLRPRRNAPIPGPHRRPPTRWRRWHCSR